MDVAPQDNLYVKGLPAACDEPAIKTIFGAYGNVVSVKMLPCPPGVTDVAALVRMSSVEEATWLVTNVNGNIPSGLTTPVTIRFASSGKGKGKDKGAGAVVMPPPMFGRPAPVPFAPVEPGQPTNRLYVKGYPQGITEEQVKQVMSAYGTVNSVKVLKVPPGAVDAACIVQMSTVEEAQWLVTNLDGNIPNGLAQPVQVKFKTDNPGAGAASAMAAVVPPGARPGAGVARSASLDVRGLPEGFSEDTIKLIFSSYGSVVSCSVTPSPYGSPETCCTLTMSSVEEAQWLVDNLNGNIPHNLTSPVTISFKPGVGAAVGGYGVPPPMATPVYPPSGYGGVPPPRPVAEPSDNLYIKGLPIESTEESLRTIFSNYGNVTSARILASPPGKMDAAALVRMQSLEEAKWLIDNVNGNIPVGLTQPVEIRYASNSKGKGKGGSNVVVPPPQMMAHQVAAPAPVQAPHQPSDNLYMKGFPEGITEDQLKQILSAYGTIVQAKVLQSPPGKGNAACLVRMASLDEAKWLVDNLNGNIPQGLTSPVEVKFAANNGGARAAPY
eukprot:TRINITY_DN425_c4_g1_i1.p1 TRINITY_DN425_c4_g1~~TRINITY_DN425_c4_g1_i1.p1  ORF type:complete len:553 (-),score=112.95 TRINITY_DN425_c4_g1_i1:186-1844(-)